MIYPCIDLLAALADLLLAPLEPSGSRLFHIPSIRRRHGIDAGYPPEGAMPVAGAIFQFAQQERDDGRPHSDDFLEGGMSDHIAG
jgi:hypothetical protein